MPIEVNCPICRKRTPWAGNRYRPFCSERCQLIDLAAWADGEYAIEGPELDDESVPSPDEED